MLIAVISVLRSLDRMRNTTIPSQKLRTVRTFISEQPIMIITGGLKILRNQKRKHGLNRRQILRIPY